MVILTDVSCGKQLRCVVILYFCCLVTIVMSCAKLSYKLLQFMFITFVMGFVYWCVITLCVMCRFCCVYFVLSYVVMSCDAHFTLNCCHYITLNSHLIHFDHAIVC